MLPPDAVAVIQYRNLKPSPAVACKLVTEPIVPVAVVLPAGLVVPPTEEKTEMVAEPVVDAVAVVFVVGVNIASIAQSLEVMFNASGLTVVVLAPDAVTVSQHRNWKPVPAAALKFTVVPTL